MDERGADDFAWYWAGGSGSEGAQMARSQQQRIGTTRYSFPHFGGITNDGPLVRPQGLTGGFVSSVNLTPEG